MLEKYAVLNALRTVLTHSGTKFSVTGLAKAAGMAPSAAKYSLDYMLAQGLVKKEVIGRSHLYRADTGSYLARQWKVLFSLQDIRKSGLVEEVLRRIPSVSSIVLYGSAATGTDDEKSDIDVLVVADSRRRAASGLMVIGGRELNISVYTPMEWRKKAEKDKIFYERVMLDSIVLYGEKPVVL